MENKEIIDTKTADPKKEKNKKIASGCCGILVIAFIIGIVIAIMSSSHSSNNTNKPYASTFPDVYSLSMMNIRKVEYFSDTKTVNIDFQDEADGNSPKDSVENYTAQIIEAAGKDVKGLNKISVSYYAPLQDQYGNSSTQMVFGVNMESDAIAKINWNTDSADLEENIIPQNWQVFYNFKNQF